MFEASNCPDDELRELSALYISPFCALLMLDEPRLRPRRWILSPVDNWVRSLVVIMSGDSSSPWCEGGHWANLALSSSDVSSLFSGVDGEVDGEEQSELVLVSWCLKTKYYVPDEFVKYTVMRIAIPSRSSYIDPLNAAAATTGPCTRSIAC